MREKFAEEINFAMGDADPLVSLIGKRVFCQKGNREFVATLIGIKGDELYFKTRGGKIIMDRRSEISHIQALADEQEA